MTRKCSTCKHDFPLNSEYFHKDKTDLAGFYHKCKPCANKRSRVYNANNREYFKKKGKERYKKSENPARYQRYQTQYLERRGRELQTVHGRLYQLVRAAKSRASQKNLEFSIDLAWVKSLWENQAGTCSLSGLPLTLEYTPNGRTFHPFNPSLDRIVPERGYTKDNVRLVCVLINLALNDFGEATFRRVCKAYLSKQPSEEPLSGPD